MTTSNTLSVVLGAGQIGSRVAQLLLARGQRVRVVRRGPAPTAAPGLEHARGDLADLRFAEEACRGAAVVYDCTNPAYDQWHTRLLPLGRGALHGAATAKARLVALDNLYPYGRVERPMTETTPVAPCSKKGELRAQLARERLEADARGDVKVALGRASDFFGPGVTSTSIFGERFYRRVLSGQAGEYMGDADLPHAYSFGEDVAQGLVTLGTNEGAGGVWHLPTAPAESTRELATRLFAFLGRPVKLTRLPNLVLKTMGLFSPLLREVAEMTYQWETPFLLSDAKFRARFGGAATPLASGAQVTARWALEAYSPGVTRQAA